MEDNSCLRGVEGQLRTTAQLVYPNPMDAEDPMIAPPNYDVRQSGTVLEFQKRDLRLRPTDLSWHSPIFMTIREKPFENYRARSSATFKTKEDKIEEAMKQKTHRSNDEWNSAEWQPSSWLWQQPVTWASSSSSSWQQWSSDQTCERSDWQSPADWDSSTQTRELWIAIVGFMAVTILLPMSQ